MGCDVFYFVIVFFVEKNVYICFIFLVKEGKVTWEKKIGQIKIGNG